MSTTTLFLVLILQRGDAAARPSGDAWFAADKVKHFVASAFVQSMAFSAFRLTKLDHRSSILGASAATAAVGVVKELHDARVKHEFSARDLVWDGLGAGASAALLRQTR